MTTFGDILRFDPEHVSRILGLCTARASTMGNLGLAARRADIPGWTGTTATAAKAAAGQAQNEIHAHSAHLNAVATALRNCQADATALKGKVRACIAAADGAKLVIDNVTGRVSDPHPPVMTGWTEAQRKSYVDKIAALQRDVNMTVAAGGQLDAKLAAAFSGTTAADGPDISYHRTPGKETEGPSPTAAAAFKKAYGREPVSANDWMLAAAIDPATHDPKYKGVPANVTITKISPVAGAGVYRQNMYIPSTKVANLDTSWPFLPGNAGDNRGPSSTAGADQSRVSVYVDYDNGYIITRQNPSVDVYSGEIKCGTPLVKVNQDATGKLDIQYRAADPLAPPPGNNPAAMVPKVSGTMTLIPSGGGDIQASGTVTQYPSTEGYQYKPDGTTRTLFSHEATKSQFGPIVGLPQGEVVKINPTLPGPGNGPTPTLIPTATPAPVPSPGPATTGAVPRPR